MSGCTLRAVWIHRLYPFDADDVKREEYVDFARWGLSMA